MKLPEELEDFTNAGKLFPGEVEAIVRDCAKVCSDMAVERGAAWGGDARILTAAILARYSLEPKDGSHE